MRLVRLPVGDFVAKVASTEEPVPAGGSVSALTGASAAALLALACGVMAKRGVNDADALRSQADALQRELLVLVDEDAAAYHAFLAAKHDAATIARMSDVPVRTAAACRDVTSLAEVVSARIAGAIAADVHAARTLAEAARAAALDLAEANIAFQRDPLARSQLKERIQDLRA